MYSKVGKVVDLHEKKNQVFNQIVFWHVTYS